MRCDDILDLHEELNNWHCYLFADFLKEIGNYKHHDQRKESKWKNEYAVDICSYIVVYVQNLAFDYFTRHD